MVKMTKNTNNSFQINKNNEKVIDMTTCQEYYLFMQN